MIDSAPWYKYRFEKGPHCCGDIKLAMGPAGLDDYTRGFARIIWDNACSREPEIWKTLKEKAKEELKKYAKKFVNAGTVNVMDTLKGPKNLATGLPKVINRLINPDANPKKNEACNEMIDSAPWYKYRFEKGPNCCGVIKLAKGPAGLDDYTRGFARIIWDNACSREPKIWKTLKEKAKAELKKYAKEFAGINRRK